MTEHHEGENNLFGWEIALPDLEDIVDIISGIFED